MATQTEQNSVYFFVSGNGMSDAEDVFSWVNEFLDTGDNNVMRLYNCGALCDSAAGAISYAAQASVLKNEPPLAMPGDNFLKRLMKKVMFKLCGWYFEYMRGQQSEFNQRAAHATATVLQVQREQQGLLCAMRGHANPNA